MLLQVYASIQTCGSWYPEGWTALSWSGILSHNCARSGFKVTRCVYMRVAASHRACKHESALKLNHHVRMPSWLQAAVYSVAFSPTHPLIASGSKDRSVRLWQPTV